MMRTMGSQILPSTEQTNPDNWNQTTDGKNRAAGDTFFLDAEQHMTR